MQITFIAGFATDTATGNAVVAGATTTAFDTDLTDADGAYNGSILSFDVGSALDGQTRTIATYVQANGHMTFAEPFGAAPSGSANGFTVKKSLATSVPGEIRERIKNYIAYCFEHRAERDEKFLDSLFDGFSAGHYF